MPSPLPNFWAALRAWRLAAREGLTFRPGRARHWPLARLVRPSAGPSRDPDALREQGNGAKKGGVKTVVRRVFWVLREGSPLGAGQWRRVGVSLVQLPLEGERRVWSLRVGRWREGAVGKRGGGGRRRSRALPSSAPALAARAAPALGRPPLLCPLPAPSKRRIPGPSDRCDGCPTAARRAMRAVPPLSPLGRGSAANHCVFCAERGRSPPAHTTPPPSPRAPQGGARGRRTCGPTSETRCPSLAWLWA